MNYKATLMYRHKAFEAVISSQFIVHLPKIQMSGFFFKHVKHYRMETDTQTNQTWTKFVYVRMQISYFETGEHSVCA